MELFVTSINMERLVRYKDDFPPHHEDKLINLQIVQRETRQTLGRDNTKRITIPYSDLFKTEYGKKSVKRILVEGDAGIGKTSLCISLSEDWANEKLFQQFDLLLLLPLRQTSVASANSVPALLHFLYPSSEVCNSVVSAIEKNQGENLLIVADGWDELNESKQQEGSFLYNLLFGEHLPFASVVVTTRPLGLSNVYRIQRIDRFVEVRGFSKENIKAYFKAELSSDQTKVLEVLDSNPLLEDICSIPLNCVLVCHLWQCLDELLPSTMTELYTKIVLCHIFRNVRNQNCYKDIHVLRNFDSIPVDLVEPWWHLCRFAFQAIEKNTVAFSEESLIDCFPQGSSVDNNIFSFGLLQSTESILDIGYGVSYHFLHLTFQEYLAALYLAKQSPEVQREICKSRANSQRYSIVWRFFCGIAFNKSNENMVSCMLSPAGTDMATLLVPNKNPNVSAVSLLHYAYEAKNDTVTAIIAKGVSKKGMFLRPHSIFDCLAINYVIENSTQECDIDLNYSNCGVEDKQVIALADSLNKPHDKFEIVSLDLCNNQISEKSIVYLLNKCSGALTSLKYLYLGGNNIGHEGVKSVMDVVPKSCFKRFDISHNPIGTLGLLEMEIAMKTGKFLSLKRLDMQGCFPKLDANSLKSFLKGVSVHCQNLWYLDISDNSTDLQCAAIIGKEVTLMMKRSQRFSLKLNKMIFGDKGVVSFIQNLESECHFKLLTLEDNDIHAMGASCLADKICIMRQNFSEALSLKDNPLGLEGVSVIGRILSSRHCHIKTLTLSNCQLTVPSGAVTGDSATVCKTFMDVGNFLFCLPQYNTIESLTLDNNTFTGERIRILAGLMHLCLHLEILSCVSCNITSDDARHLLFLLSKLKRHLLSWDLSSNKIDDGGIITLLQSAPLFCDGEINIYIWDNPVSVEMRKKIDKRSQSEWKIQSLMQEYMFETTSSHMMEDSASMIAHLYYITLPILGCRFDDEDEEEPLTIVDVPGECEHPNQVNESWERNDASYHETPRPEPQELPHLNEVLDFGHGGVPTHLGMIAKAMYEWKGPVADSLGLTSADVAAIKTMYPGELLLQTRAALEKWKQRLGPEATYKTLIASFEYAGYSGYAETVRNVARVGHVPQLEVVPTMERSSPDLQVS